MLGSRPRSRSLPLAVSQSATSKGLSAGPLRCFRCCTPSTCGLPASCGVGQSAFGRTSLRSPTSGGSQGRPAGLLVVAEVQVVARGGWAALALVLGARRFASVGVLGGAAHPQEG